MKLKLIFIFMIFSLVLVGGVSAVEISDNAGADNSTIASDISQDDDILEMSNDEKVLGDEEGTFSQLETIIKGNDTGSTIYLDKDYVSSNYSKSVITIDKKVTIDGQGHVVDGQDNSRIFYINASGVVLKNIIFKNAKNNTLTYDSVSDAVIQDCKFTDNIIQDSEVYFTGENLTIENCEFVNSTTIPNAGDTGTSFLGVYSTGNVIVSKSKFKNSNLGYGIYISYAGNVTLKDIELNNLTGKDFMNVNNESGEITGEIFTGIVNPGIIAYSWGNVSLVNINIVNVEAAYYTEGLIRISAEGNIDADNVTIINVTEKTKVEAQYDPSLKTFEYTNTTGEVDAGLKFQALNGNVTLSNLNVENVIGGMETFLNVRGYDVSFKNISIINSPLTCLEGYSIEIIADNDVVFENVVADNITQAPGRNVTSYNHDYFKYIYSYQQEGEEPGFSITIYAENNANVTDVKLTNIVGGGYKGIIHVESENITADNILVENVTPFDNIFIEYDYGLSEYLYTEFISEECSSGLKFDGDGVVNVTNIKINNTVSSGYFGIFHVNGDEVTVENISLLNSKIPGEDGNGVSIEAENNISIKNINIDNLSAGLCENITRYNKEYGKYIWFSEPEFEGGPVGLYVRSEYGNIDLHNLNMTNLKDAGSEFIYLYASNITVDNVIIDNVSQYMEIQYDYNPYLDEYTYDSETSQEGSVIVVEGNDDVKVSNIKVSNYESSEGFLEILGNNVTVENFSVEDSAISARGSSQISANEYLTVNNFTANNISKGPGWNHTRYVIDYGKYIYDYKSNNGGFGITLNAEKNITASDITLTNIEEGPSEGVLYLDSKNMIVDSVLIDNVTPSYYIEIEYMPNIGQYVVMENMTSESGGGIYSYSNEGVSKFYNIIVNNMHITGEESPIFTVNNDKLILENITLSNIHPSGFHYTLYNSLTNKYTTDIYCELEGGVISIGADYYINITNMLVDNVPSCPQSIEIEAENVTIDNATFRNIVSFEKEYKTDDDGQLVLRYYTNGGECVVVNGDNILIFNSNFENITAGVSYEYGGALVIKSDNQTLLENCTFRDIVSQDSSYYDGNEYHYEDAYGGAVVIKNGILRNIVNSQFINCSSKYGGVIYSILPLNITGSKFINNSAKFGGAIYVDGAGLFVNDTLFEGNNATNGGAIFFTNQSANNTVYGSTFIKNIASENGGALYIFETNNTGVNVVNASVFYRNHAEYNGGAFFFNDTINRMVWEDYRWHNATASSKIHNDLTFVSSPLARTMIILNEFEENSDYALNITAHNNAAGGNHTVTIVINEIAKGYVYVNITDKNGNFIKDKNGNEINGGYLLVNGSVLLELEDLAIGEYNVSAYYSTWEYEVNPLYYHINSTIFSIYPHELNVTANRTIYADENLTVIAELNNLTTGTVNITVSNENYTLTFNEIPVVNGTVKYNIAGLYAGDYNVTVTYNGDDIFYVKSNSTNVTVLKRQSQVEVSVKDNVYGNVTKIIVEVPKKQTGNVTVTINNQTYTKELTNGTVEFEVPGLTAGEWEANVTFNENRVYEENNTVFRFNVTKANLTVNVIGNNVTVKDNACFSIEVPEDFNGNVTLTIGDKTYYDGPVSNLVNITALPAGDYTANLTFYGDNNYNDAKINADFTVSPVEPEMNVTITNATYGGNATATVSVSGNANGTVNIVVDGKTYSGDVVNGMATVTLNNLTAGVKEADVKFITSDKYNSNTTATAEFTVAKINSTVVISNLNTTVIIKVSDNATGNITVYVNGEKHIKELVDSQIVIEDILIAGENSVVAIYDGDANYYGSENSTGIMLPLKIVVTDLLADEKRVVINVTGVSSGNVTVIVDNGQRNITKNLTDGNAIFDLTDLSQDIHTIDIICPDGTVEEMELDGRVNGTLDITSIKSEDMVRGYNSPYDYQAAFLDKEGNALVDVTVIFKVNGKEYKVKTDKEGVAQLYAKLAVGKYNITSINTVTGEEETQTLEIVKRILENKDLTMEYLDGSKFKVKVIGDDGNIAPEGEIIDIMANGVHYVAKVDKKGYASLKITLLPKKYTITAEYKGYKTTNKLVVKQTLKPVKKTIKVKKGKKITIKATLKWSNGKGIKGKVIKFKVKGKTYKAKTNSKGLAKVVIKNKKILKSFKKGKKYTVKITYAVKQKFGNGYQTIKDTVKCKVKIK